MPNDPDTDAENARGPAVGEALADAEMPHAPLAQDPSDIPPDGDFSDEVHAQEHQPRPDPHAVPIVGIGASAGGIEALGEFFDAAPTDSGWAFVVVLHLDPTRESQLSAVLSSHTRMPVQEIEDGQVIQRDHVYVIAPNKNLTVRGDTLRLTGTQQPRGRRHPVDVLFASLAEQRQERTVAIVLSGTGTNGTQGLKEIKAAGGLIIIQEPHSARFDGMPRSAIGAGLADHVLPPAEMHKPLLRYFQHNYIAAPEAPLDESGSPQHHIGEILALLRANAGQDFRSYKPATLLRRINRRMSLRGLTELGHYLTMLRAEPEEVKSLVRDLLINVTSFFRDHEAWAELDQTVLKQLVADREDGVSVRVWIPACSTGEEAYSVAMLLLDRAEAAHKLLDIKIFASDISDENLNTARAGIYPGASVEMLPYERIRRYFERLDGSYQIRRSLRDLVIFARQDLLRDPPFSRMDLITCRNMLIYIEPEAQRRALALFHFALREGGRLFLGSAETIGRADDLFETVSKKWRIYRRLGPTRHDIISFPVLGGHPNPAVAAPGQDPEALSSRVIDTARRALLDRYAPASVLIDSDHRVIFFHGDTGDYLQQPGGEPTRDLLAMARDGLAVRLRVALQTIAADRTTASFKAAIRQGNDTLMALVTVAPIRTSQQAEGMVLVSFQPESGAAQAPAIPFRAETSENAAAMENELRSTRSDLQGVIEQLESVNEEMRSASEEATSMNEELQSTNEELETSKEELQSFNEELHSVNSQLQHKINELDTTSNDLANLLSGTEIATVFLDTEFRIKWFSPSTRQLFDFVTTDIGRPISHFALKFADDSLMDDAEAVLETLAPMEADIRSDAGAWFMRRIMPYRTRENRIAGLVITFSDITERRRAAETINEARIYAEAIVETGRHSLVVLDSAVIVQSANQAFYRLLSLPAGAAIGRSLYDLGKPMWDTARLGELMEDVLSPNPRLQDVEMAFGPPGMAQRCVLMNARKLVRHGGRADLILLAIEDITDRKRASAHQEMLIGELNHRVKNVLATVQALMAQTARRSSTLDGFITRFTGRLHALAKAHNLLVEKEWIGADVGQIVRDTLAPYRLGSEHRIVAEGPPLMVRPQVGVALMLIFHELATNALKYGSLSAPAGTLSVKWHQSGEGRDERFHVVWVEAGGPPVTPPTHIGFGTSLLERSTKHELGGNAVLEYLPEGVRCEIIFPWAGKEVTGPDVV